MKRKCTVIKSSESFNRAICIDLENADSIADILFHGDKYKNKFEYIVGRILEQSNIYYSDYERIYNKSGIKISEMRFFPNGDNCRIYCREVVLNGTLFCIVMAIVLAKKKSNKINKDIKQLIEKIKTYEYELE